MCFLACIFYTKDKLTDFALKDSANTADSAKIYKVIRILYLLLLIVFTFI